MKWILDPEFSTGLAALVCAHAACFDLVHPAAHLPSQVEGFVNSILDARNGEISGGAERQTPNANALHFSGTGMSGHDFPTVGKLLQIHGGVTHYLLLCGGKRNRPPGESQSQIRL